MGSPREGLLRPRPHIYHFSAGPSKASREPPWASVPNIRGLGPPPASNPPRPTGRASLVEISLFLFSRGFARGDKSTLAAFPTHSAPAEVERSTDRAELGEADVFHSSSFLERKGGAGIWEQIARIGGRLSYPVRKAKVSRGNDNSFRAVFAYMRF